MLKTILRLFKQSRGYCALLFLVSLILGIIPPLIISYESELIDALLNIFNDKEQALLISVISLFILYTIQSALPISKNYISKKLKHRYDKEYSSIIMRKMIRTNYGIIENKANMDLFNRVSNDIENEASDLVIKIFDVIAIIVGLVGYLVIIFSASFITGIVFILLFIVLYVCCSKAARAFHNLNVHFAETERKIMYLDSVTNKKDYAYEKKIFDYTDYVSEKRTNFLTEQRNKMRKFDFKFGFSYASIDTFGYICTLINIIVMIPLMKNNVIAVGLFIAIIRASLNINLTTQNQLRDILENILRHKHYWEDYDKFMNLPEQITDFPKRNVHTDFQINTLEFKNVSFSYSNGTKVLSNVSFILERGKHYALVGANGSGKSTITKLMLKLYDVNSGEILINGININNFGYNELISMYSVVFQDFARYNIELIENVCFAHLNDVDAFDDVVRKTDMANLIEKLPNKETTMLGQVQAGGIDISGGEWQKIALARALYANGSMLILDEPTSNLDPITESHLYEKYKEITNGKTTLFISHRLGSTKIADKIFVLSDGYISETGTHADLMSKKGMYYKMFSAQKKWYINGGSL